MRVLVCGGRDFTDKDLIYKTLYDFCDKHGLWYEPDEYGNTFPTIHIISGEARGVDRIATAFAVVNWTGYSGFPADWNKYGKAAGYIRNKQMLEEGKPDVVIAFPGGKGTEMMKKMAREAGVEVIEIDAVSRSNP